MPSKRNSGKVQTSTQHDENTTPASASEPPAVALNSAAEQASAAGGTHVQYGRQQRYRVGNVVLVRNENGDLQPQVGSVVAVPHRAKPTRFKIRYKHKKDGKGDLALAPPSSITDYITSSTSGSGYISSSATCSAAVVANPASTAQTSFHDSNNRNGNANQGCQWPSFPSSPTSSSTASATPPSALLSSAERGEPLQQSSHAIGNSASDVSIPTPTSKRSSTGQSGPVDLGAADNKTAVEADSKNSPRPATAVAAMAAQAGTSFNVSDMVIVMDKHGHPSDATVVSVDNTSDPPLFKVRSNDKRRKEGWKTGVELTASVGGAPAPSSSLPAAGSHSSSAAAFQRKLLRGGAEAVLENGSRPTSNGSPQKAGRQAKPPSPAAAAAAAATCAVGRGRSNSRKKSERSSSILSSDVGVVDGVAGETAHQNNAVASTAKSRSRRAAAKAATIAMAAAAAESTRRKTGPAQKPQENTDNDGGRLISSEIETAVASSKKQKGKRISGRATGTPALSGIKRPRNATPGLSLDGDVASSSPAETALRATHPTEGIRRRKLGFIKQPQQDLPQAPARCGSTKRDASASDGTPHARVGTSSALPPAPRQALRRPLFQPSHPLHAANQPQQQQHDKVGGKSSAGDDCEQNSSVRRGGRVRKTVYSRLCEDVLGAAAAFGRVEDGEEGEGDGDVDNHGEASSRFITSSDAPWGSGAQPLVKVELNLVEGREPLLAERSALAVVTFATDRHRYSGEQLANVLTSEGFLCYCDEQNKVYVLTESDPGPQKQALERVQDAARIRCGVQVEASTWLSGRRALDEFLGNHMRVVRHVVRHRLAAGMWSEVGGVYFNGLFCGRRSKRTFNGVRLGVKLAASDMSVLESGVWELWITVEPAVHRFAPVDWWQLLREKEEKDLADFSGSISDDLEELLHVVCLPNLSRGRVYDVQEDAFDMDRIQDANLARGYLVGPQSENEVVEYWRQVHLINLPPTSFVFVKVLISGMVLTYPSWCVLRGQGEVVEATQALRGRILDSFADALDAMDGMAVMESTFSWKMVADVGARGYNYTDAPPVFATANGTVIGRSNKRHTVEVSFLSTPGPTASEGGGTDDGREEQCSGEQREICCSIVTPHAPSEGLVGTPSAATTVSHRDADFSSEDDRLVRTPPIADVGSNGVGAAAVSPESTAAAAAAQASMAVIRKSVIRRRGAVPAVVQRPISPASSAQADEDGATPGPRGSSGRLCSVPFVIRRAPTSAGQQSRETDRRKATLVRAVDLSGCGNDDGRGSGIDGSKKQATVGVLDTPQAGGQGSETRTTDGSEAHPAHLVTPCGGPPVGVVGENEGSPPSDKALAVAVTETGATTTSKRRLSGGKGRKRATTDGGDSDTTGAHLYKSSLRGSGSATNDAAGHYPPAGLLGKAAGATDGDGEAAAPSPAERPTKIVVTFSAAGSLGIGLGEDETEEGTVVLEGKSPTSAAAAVPDGWRIAEVDGQNVRCAGGEKVATLLRARPVQVTFEATSPSPPTPAKTGRKTTKKPPAAAGTSRKRTSAKEPRTAKMPKKTAKVTTVRKAFKVQSAKAGDSLEASGGGGSGAGAGTVDMAAI